MRYPSIIHFEPTNDGVSVKYKEDAPNRKKLKCNLDIWAISYLLNEGLYRDDSTNVVHLDIIDITTALRFHFLSRVGLFKNIQFEACQPNSFQERAKDILNNVGATKKYVTYGKGYDLPVRKTKEKQSESLLESNICHDISRVFGGEFPASAPVIRQFPANIFEGEIAEPKRITRKFWVDMLTVNRFNQLSVVELKAGGNAPLDLLMQAIDYGIVCHLFKNTISDRFPGGHELVQNKIAIYCVAEKFHPAIVGNESWIGLTSLIQNNALFDIVLVQIEVKNSQVVKVVPAPRDTRRL
ncbi:MAG: hypothetical protein JW720_00545 [Sedimentisphaerales bacterium]|nr:hypothetical protein [Sedimentisphaerales bacterium]